MKTITTILLLSGELSGNHLHCREKIKQISFELELLRKKNEEQIRKTEIILKRFEEQERK